MGFPSGSAVKKKNPLTMQETRIRSLGLEDPLKEEMVTHFSILAGKIPWTEKSGEWGRKEFNMTERTHTHTHTNTLV